MTRADDARWMRAEIQGLMESLEEYAQQDLSEAAREHGTEEAIVLNYRASAYEHAAAHLRRILSGKTFEEHLAEVLRPHYKRPA